MAHDRLPQMDILRRFGAGTLGELFGALDQGTVETDLEMRVHRMKPIAEETWATLQASSDPEDQKLVKVLERFADGVNAYDADLQAGKWTIDPAVATSFDAQRFTPWTPVDSLILGRFQAFALSWTTPIKLDITDVYQNARDDLRQRVADRRRRRTPGAASRPTCSTSRRSGATRRSTAGPTSPPTPAPGPTAAGPASAAQAARGRRGKARPTCPTCPVLFDNAREFFRARVLKDGARHAVAPRVHDPARRLQRLGGRAEPGRRQGAGRRRPAPAAAEPVDLLPVHLTVPGEVDAEGVTFPGIPGIILGHNGKVAWQATVAFHDVNDVYLENISPCATGGGDCVAHDGQARSRSSRGPRPSRSARSARSPRRSPRPTRWCRTTGRSSRPSRTAWSCRAAGNQALQRRVHRLPADLRDPRDLGPDPRLDRRRRLQGAGQLRLRRPELGDRRQPGQHRLDHQRQDPAAQARGLRLERRRPTPTAWPRSSSCPATARPTGTATCRRATSRTRSTRPTASWSPPTPTRSARTSTTIRSTARWSTAARSTPARSTPPGSGPSASPTGSRPGRPRPATSSRSTTCPTSSTTRRRRWAASWARRSRPPWPTPPTPPARRPTSRPTSPACRPPTRPAWPPPTTCSPAGPTPRRPGSIPAPPPRT